MNWTSDPLLLQAVLRHVVQLLGMSGGELAQLRGVDPSLVTRLLSGDRELTPAALEPRAATGVPAALLERLPRPDRIRLTEHDPSAKLVLS